MAENAVLGAAVTPTVFFESIAQLKKCTFAIPFDRNTTAVGLADEIIGSGKKERKKLC